MDIHSIIAANAIGRPIRTGILPRERLGAHHWTTREERIVRDNYRRVGMAALMRMLPGRSRQTIRQRAYMLRRRAAA